MNIHLYSLHGLFRGQNSEIGRDADNGGQIVYVLELARELSRHPSVKQVTLFTRLIDDPQLDSAYAQPEERVNEKFMIRRIPFGGNAYLPKEQLWSSLDEFVAGVLHHVRTTGDRPDVIHGHYADAAYAGAKVSAALNVRFIQTGHSLGRPKLVRLLADGMPEVEAMETFRFAERFSAENESLARANFIVTSTTQEISTYQDYANHGAGRYEVIPPGIDFARFRPYYSPLPTEHAAQARVSVKAKLKGFLRDPSKPMIVAVCRADRKKNIEALVHAYGTDPTLQAMANLVLWVGLRDDITQMLPGVQQVLQNLILLQDRYNLYGRLAIPKKHDPLLEVPALYRMAAESQGVFVNVALTEPFGLTLLEAGATGLPVVATSDGGPAEIVPSCKNGILVSPGDHAEIQSALRTILTNEELWLNFSHAGIRNVRAHYNWEKHVERYIDLIGTIAN